MLVFIDESGHPRPNDSTLRPVLTAVCIQEQDLKSIVQDVYRLKKDIYGKQDEIKATKLLRPQTIVNNRTHNKTYADEMIKILTRYNTGVFAVVMEKPDFCPYVEPGYLPKHYYYLMKRIELYSAKYNYGKSMIIFDCINEADDRKISVAVTNFLYKSVFGQTFKNILEMPLFVNSSITPGIQFADITAGIIRHYFERDLDQRQPSSQYEEWINGLFQSVKSRSEDLIEPFRNYREYGIFTMRKASFPKNPYDSLEIDLT